MCVSVGIILTKDLSTITRIIHFFPIQLLNPSHFLKKGTKNMSMATWQLVKKNRHENFTPPHSLTSVQRIEVGAETPNLYFFPPPGGRLTGRNQYSQREDASTVGPSPIRVPPWSPRRYLPLELLMAMRPCSTNSRKKSSGFSPSEHTRPLLDTYQNFPFVPAEGCCWIRFWSQVLVTQ